MGRIEVCVDEKRVMSVGVHVLLEIEKDELVLENEVVELEVKLLSVLRNFKLFGCNVCVDYVGVLFSCRVCILIKDSQIYTCG